MARLPIPGKDTNIWGSILNDFLNTEHTGDGKLKIRTDGTLDNFVQGPLTKSSVGLAHVDDTSDAAKPISSTQQAALATKITTDDAVALAIAL